MRNFTARFARYGLRPDGRRPRLRPRRMRRGAGVSASGSPSGRRSRRARRPHPPRRRLAGRAPAMRPHSSSSHAAARCPATNSHPRPGGPRARGPARRPPAVPRPSTTSRLLPQSREDPRAASSAIGSIPAISRTWPAATCSSPPAARTSSSAPAATSTPKRSRRPSAISKACARAASSCSACPTRRPDRADHRRGRDPRARPRRAGTHAPRHRRHRRSRCSARRATMWCSRRRTPCSRPRAGR